MSFLKITLLGVISLSFVGCCCTQTTSMIAQKGGIKLGGVAGLLKNGPQEACDTEPVVFDPCYVPFEKKGGGPVEFEVPIERNFKPSPQNSRPFCKKKGECDLVPCAIEREMDRGRNARIRRLVQ